MSGDVPFGPDHPAFYVTERAHIGVVPFCPKCGSGAIFLRRPTVVGEEVPIHCSDGRCGWVGCGPQTIPLPMGFA